MIAFITGFASSQLFNPALAIAGPLQGVLFTMIGLALIMATNLHHLMIQAIVVSYDLLEAGQGLFIEDMSKKVNQVVQESYNLAFKLSAPIFISNGRDFCSDGIVCAFNATIANFLFIVAITNCTGYIFNG